VDKDPIYTRFYKRMADRGDFIIMDNGAFELGQSYAPEKLIELGTKCGAQVIVLPDYPGSCGAVTIAAAKEWGPEIRDAGFGTMFVPQSRQGDLEDWISSYGWASENSDIDIIGMSILGIPNALPHIPAAFARVVMVKLLQNDNIFNHTKYHHFLGLNAGPNIEIPSLLLMGALDTCDSSNPVWCGINGITYDLNSFDHMTYRKSILPSVDFSAIAPTGYIFSKTMKDRITHNIDITLDIFHTPQMYL
jgi:hypothetical protein